MSAQHLATAFVRVRADTTMAESGIASLRSSLLSLRSLFALLAASGTALAATSFAVKAASDAEEANNLFREVFKEQAEAAEQFARQFASRVGRGFNEVRSQLSGFQDVFVPLGFGREEARKLSEQLVKTTTDVASFKNRSDSDVARAFIAALTGEREQLKSLGIVISENDVKVELARMGMAKLTGEAEKQAKAVATLNLILRGSADATNDAERTADGFANRMRALRGQFADTVVEIGSKFLPMATQLVNALSSMANNMRPRFIELADSIANLVGHVDGVVAAFNLMANTGLRLAQGLVDTANFIRNTFSASIVESTAKVVAFSTAFTVAASAVPRIVSALSAMVRVVQSLSKATAIAQALTGPKGWAQVAAGVAAGAAAVIAIDKLFANFESSMQSSNIAAVATQQAEAFDAQAESIEKLVEKYKGLDMTQKDVKQNKPDKLDIEANKVDMQPRAPEGFKGFVDITEANRMIQRDVIDRDEWGLELVRHAREQNRHAAQMVGRLGDIVDNTRKHLPVAGA